MKVALNKIYKIYLQLKKLSRLFALLGLYLFLFENYGKQLEENTNLIKVSRLLQRKVLYQFGNKAFLDVNFISIFAKPAL